MALRKETLRRLWFVPVAAVSLAVGVPFWRAHRTLTESREAQQQEGRAGVSVRVLAVAAPPGVEPLATPFGFRDAVVFQQRVWLGGAGGIQVGSQRLRAGLELPAAPVTALATGLSAGGQRLFAATDGEGLLIHDGSQWLQVLPQRPEHRKLTALLPLPSGRVLLGTARAGVLSWDGLHIQAFHPSLAGLSVTALAGSESDLWVGTLDAGVRHWRAGQVTSFSDQHRLPDKQVLSLSWRAGRVFAGTPLGVAEFSEGRFQRMWAEGFLARSLLDRGDTLLVGTLEDGVLEIPLQARQTRGGRPPSARLGAPVERLLESGDSVAAVTPLGLFVRSAAGWMPEPATEPALLADRNIAALSVDPSGRLWIGYFDRGLDILESGQARHVENERVFCVNRIVHDRDRGLAAVATANGLVLFDTDGSPRQVLLRADGLIADHVTDVLAAAGRTIAATSAGLTILDAHGARSLHAFHGLVSNHACALAADGDRLMVGTLGGASLLEGGLVRASFTTANSGLRHNWIAALLADSGVFFAGTYGAGVFRFDRDGIWSQLGNQAFTVNPHAMAITPRLILAGTLDRGLAVFDRLAERWQFRTAGLPSRNVTALAISGNVLYVGTTNGMVRISGFLQ